MSGWFGRHLVAVCCVVCGVVLVSIAFTLGYWVRPYLPPYQVGLKAVLP